MKKRRLIEKIRKYTDESNIPLFTEFCYENNLKPNSFIKKAWNDMDLRKEVGRLFIKKRKVLSGDMTGRTAKELKPNPCGFYCDGNLSLWRR